MLAIAVGAGGAAVTADGKNGNSGHPSSLTIADETFAALKGGYGGCYTVYGNGEGGSEVACGGGAGGYNNNKRTGGDGVTSDGATVSGGGGGGGGAGGDASGVLGGVGVPVTIFDDTEYYIAGGGAGCGRKASSLGGLGGGGNGGTRNGTYWNEAATSGSRWGAGGGGTDGGGCYPSGAGYQGVVVVRFVEEANVAVMPAIPETMYSGEQQVAQLVGGQGFEVVENEGGVEAGTNEVVIALADGYSSWEDGETGTQRTLDFVITKADHNEWNPEPSISKDTWTTTDENPGVLTAGRTTFGPVTATYTRNGVDQGTFEGTLPTEAGTYVITYVAPDETGSYVTVAEEDKVKTVEFMIVMANAVAKVGDYDTFETVADAFAAAKDGDTILMLQSATVDVPVEVTNDVKLVLAGYEVSAGGRTPDTLFLVKGGAKLTVDGSAEGSLLSGAVCVESGTLNMAHTKVVATGDAIVAGAGNVTLNLGAGNEVTSAGGYAIRETYADVEATAVHAISVTGGSYSGELGTFVATEAFDAAMEAGTATCAFEKANYTKPIDAKYVAAGHLQKKLEDGSYCIGPAADTEALMYTWNGNGDTNLWQAANWSINKTLAPDAYVGFPNSYDLATAVFPAGGEPIEVKLTDDVSVKALKHAANAPAVTIDLDGHTLKHNLSESSYGAGVGYQYFTLRTQSGKGPLTFKNGTFVLPSGGAATGELLLDANSHVYFDNVAMPTTGKNIGATYQHTDVSVTFRNGCQVAGLNCYGGTDFLLEVDNSTAQIDPQFGRSNNARLVVRNGGKLTTSKGAFDYKGQDVTIQVEGSGSSADLAQSSYGLNGFTGKNWTIAALDGAAVSMLNIAHTFTSDPSDYDNGTRFVVSNAAFRATGSAGFNFGIHTNDTDCVSPTIVLAGNSPKFSTSCAFTFGSAAMELANPPVLELMPAPGGFAEPAISTTKNSYSLTIGSNVVVRVDVSDLKARGALRAKMAIAAVPADGTAELKVDLDQLAANTTVNDETADWRVTYKLSERNGRKVLTARVSSGGFAVIVR